MKEDDLINAIKSYIKFWENQKNKSELEKLEGLAFSILVMLDGLSGSFDGDRTDLNPQVMLHDMFYDENNP